MPSARSSIMQMQKLRTTSTSSNSRILIGFAGPKVNPDSEGTLKKAVQAVNSLEEQPDFIVFTGDLTHTTDDVQVRKDRMSQFKDIVGALKVPTVHFMAGGHEASPDRCDAHQGAFGKLNSTLDHKGGHFIVV